MSQISRIHAREVLDSRGKPTVEAEVHLTGGVVARASVPSGASTGAAEACEVRDAASPRYDGLGVQQAVENVRQKIAPGLVGMDPTDQPAIDQRMIDLDGTPQKSQLGANAILAVSLAAARAAAVGAGIPLYRYLAAMSGARPQMPIPMVNMISGGKHAGGNLDFQDVLIVPVSADYSTQLEWIVRVYRRLGKLLTDSGFEGYLVGDEGGYGPRLASNAEAVEFVVAAIATAGLRGQVTLALDVAASHFYREGGYHLAAERGQRLSSSQMIDRLESWIGRYPLTSIEDGLAESDWAGWRELTARLGSRVMLIGDDLFATHERLLQRGIDEKVANAVLIKLNQVGTLTETLRTISVARRHGYRCVVSARSGETEDDFLADLAVGTAADFIKVGSIARSERLAKYNRLLRIAEENGPS